MFGSRRRAAADERPRQQLEYLPIDEAITKVLESSSRVTFHLRGASGSCVSGSRDDLFIETKLLTRVTEYFRKLRSACGRRYEYGIVLYIVTPDTATAIRNALSPGWRSYADRNVTVTRSFDSLPEFQRWQVTEEGRYVTTCQDRMIESCRLTARRPT